MKKFLKTIIIIGIIALICLVPKLDILDFSALGVSEEQLSSYSDYYFNQLEIDEKKIYARIDEAINKREEIVYIGVKESEDITEKVNKVLTAYFYDNPKCYYVSNQYLVSTSDFKLFEYSTLTLSYTVNSTDEIGIKNRELETVIDSMLQANITEDMTDFEKEVAIHDALVEHVSYYQYEDINKIPSIKHTAYSALVQKEAVCDGYSKAFKMLLEEAGIESIIASGSTEDVAHAWNIVKLEDEYYHVDVTSDKFEQNSKYVIHTYFNLTDESISKTHVIDNKFELPECNSNKYDYYTQKDYYISNQDNLYNKLSNIVSKQNNSMVLEIKIAPKYTVRRIIDTLYDLNFNKWRSSGKTSVEYSKIQDVYIFVK